MRLHMPLREQPRSPGSGDNRGVTCPRARRRVFLVELGAAVLLAAGCAGLPGGTDAIRPLNVVVVTLDTLSARHLTQYGNDRIETPAFGRVAAEGSRLVKIDQA